MSMKRVVTLITSGLMAVMVFSGAVAFAVENTTDQQIKNRTMTTTEKPTQSTINDADKKKLIERLAERKTQAKLKLTTAQKTRLQSKCKAAQGLLAPLKTKAHSHEKGRSEVYTKVVSKLTDLSAKLKAKGANTAELDAAITTLQGKVTTFNTDITAYKQAVSDLADMDCATDPDAFQASLQSARTTLEKVNKNAADIRTHIKDVVKPALVKLRAELQGTKVESQYG